jgi:hypothetical protein
MGNYTQFHAKIPLKKDTPDEVVLLLMHAIYDPDFHTVYINAKNNIESAHPILLPDCKFFTLERWEGVFMHSAFHDEGPKFLRTNSGYYELELHCEINYGYEEVRCFIEWITPWVAGRKKKQYIGWWKNENMDFRCNEYIER